MEISQKAKNGTTHNLADTFLDIYLKKKTPTILIKEKNVPKCSFKHTIHQDMEGT